jgi:type IV pilus assembly protein PilE
MELGLHSQYAAPGRSRGFTLIEMMIVVGIIGILSAIAYPSYQNYVLRAKRSAAQQLMLDMTSREQQYMLDARSYTGTVGTGGLNVTVPTDVAATYTFAIVVDNTATPPIFTITATAIGSQLKDGNLTLNNLGQKTPSSKW